jgi:hypothetical protein
MVFVMQQVYKLYNWCNYFQLQTNQHILSIFNYPIQTLGIGTYSHIVSALPESPLHHVLTLLYERKISAVPIVDEKGVVLDVYSNSDVTVNF